MNRNATETQLIDKAGTDSAFRRRLLADPRAAIAEMLGMPLPPGMEITVLEEQPGQHYLVLPPAPPNLDALPLDELDMALVGGGRTLRPYWVNASPKNQMGGERAFGRRAKSASNASC